MAEDHQSRTAPFYDIPSRQIISVEHPAIVRNIDKAIDTLHGHSGISKILNPPKADTPANLTLRPDDVMSRPVQSISCPSNNILLKVTVPKRTGRKRKKGSNEPFTDAPSADGRPSARELLRSLRDNVGKYQVEPVGLIERTHVFRGMPDFVFSTTASRFTNRFREQILSFDYDKMKQFDLDMGKGAMLNADLIPPPSFSHGDVPFNYIYRQNPTVRQSVDTSGNVTTVNTQQAAKVLTHLVPYDIPTVPSAPRENCPPIDTLEQTLKETITVLQDIYASRPAWTRRGLRNCLKTIEQRYALRHAVPYVGYIFRSGPWRDAIIRFGYDPRTDPAAHMYQTTMFRILPREAELARDGGGGRRHTIPRPLEAQPDGSLQSDSHLFTGELPLPRDGRMWMFCDITDPLLAGIIFPDPRPEGFLRDTCDIVCDGWYGNGAVAKLKTIMRAKIQTLYEDRTPNNADFDKVLAFPDHASPESNMAEFWLDPSTASTRELQLATEIRSNIKGAPTWKGKNAAGGAALDKDQDGETAGAGGRRRKDGSGGTGRQARFEDVVAAEDESEGEEEAIEQEEIAEAVAAAVGKDDQPGRDNNQGGDDEVYSEVE